MALDKKRYYLGVDGGATKTLALCGDAAGNILGCGLAGPSNYQVVGTAAAMHAVATSLEKTLQQASLEQGQIEFTVFALSGADLSSDFELLQGKLAERFPGAAFELVNDTWAAFRAGTDASYGAVSVCGTGANAAAKSREGRRTALRSLGYDCGNWGGSADLAREALHHAFRSQEGTGPKSSLEEKVLAAFSGEFKSYDQLAQALRDDISLKIRSYFLLPTPVFELAARGDDVAQRILIRMGAVLGADCAAVLKALKMDQERCDVVLAGGMYAAARQRNPLMIDSFTLALHRSAPGAQISLPHFEPAVGAYLLAAEKGGAEIKVKGSAAPDLRLAQSYEQLALPGRLHPDLQQES